MGEKRWKKKVGGRERGCVNKQSSDDVAHRLIKSICLRGWPAKLLLPTSGQKGAVEQNKHFTHVIMHRLGN